MHSGATEWDTSPIGGADGLQRSLHYDGLERYGTVSGFPGDVITRWRGHRYDSARAETLDEVLPMVRVRNATEFLTIQRDNNASALAVYDALGNEETFEVVGVYGGEIDTGAGGAFIGLVGPAFPLDGLHGGDVDRERGVVHRGQRHAMLDDGRWLQPEPLLYLSPIRAPASHPRALGPTYAVLSHRSDPMSSQA